MGIDPSLLLLSKQQVALAFVEAEAAGRGPGWRPNLNCIRKGASPAPLHSHSSYSLIEREHPGCRP